MEVRELLERALARPVGERAAFLEAEVADPGLVQEVRRMLAYEGEASVLFSIENWQQRAERTLADWNLSEQVAGHYRLLKELGRGGMGAVYLAERADGVYQQKVAVKVLQENIHTPALAERFRQERQILAQLKHPGVTRLLDGGVLPDGRPFLVLEYVDGVPIDQYCEERQLDVEGRLRLFLQIAAVVQSAHQQLVLHLDLKPANILVTAEGEPRLLDFGIARILSEGEGGSRQTEATLRLLTPRYASPEQASGAPLGVGSDVFSLATLLYKLLTGVLPYPLENAQPLEAARILCEMSPAQPSQVAPEKVRRELEGDLDTILLQGLRKEPERRYPTVAALAEDIQRHRDSQPVMAHADSFGYRAGKFFRRNRVPVVAAGVVAAVLTVSIAAVVHSAVVARRERATAERRLKDVRDIAHSYVFDLDYMLEQIPGTSDVRAFVLKKAQTYLQAMSQESSDDDDLSRELSQGYSRIGQVQETPGMPSLDDLPGAEASFSKGAAIQRALLAKHPGEMKDRGLLLMQLRHWSQLPQFLGDMEREQKILMEAWEVGQPLTPDLRRYMDMAAVADSIGLLYCGNDYLWNFADPQAATAWFDREEGITKKYVLAHPKETENPAVIGSYERMALGRAKVLLLTGHGAEARPFYEEALRWTQRTHGEIVEDEARKLIRGYFAAYLLAMGNVKEADAMMPRPAVSHDVTHERVLSADDADALALIAAIDLESGRVAQGRSEMEKALATLEALHKNLPEDSNTSSELAWETYRLAGEKLLDGATRERLYRRAEEVARTYEATHPTVLSAAMLQSRCELGLAEMARMARDASGAEQHAAEAMRQAQKVLAAHPVQPEASSLLMRAKALRAS